MVRRCLSSLALLAVFSIAEVARAEPFKEYQIKAAFLFNFAQFTEWPAEAFPDADSPLVIGVLGADPFGSLLEETVRDEVVRGRPLVVKRYRKVEEIEKCHILFISQSEESRLERDLGALKAKPALTVSDFQGAAKRGLMIGFVTERSRIRFQINAEAAKAANLSLSSKLLRAAEIVGSHLK